MSKQQDLDRLGHAIKDAEARMKVFNTTMDAVDKEVRDLSAVERALEENVAFLKTKHIIALVQEYKKAKEDLAKIKNRLVKVRIDRESILRASKEVEEYLRKSKEEYANSLKGPNNVLAFRKKNAKK